MQSQFIKNRRNNWSNNNENQQSSLTQSNLCQEVNSFVFEGYFEGCMEMYSDVDTVGEYFNAHESWFARCAQPMKVESIGDNGYILVVGRFGSFGYEVEPKIAVVLQPPVEKVYLMHTIPLADEKPAGYDVNYQASMELMEIPIESSEFATKSFFKSNISSLPSSITRVEWQLDLTVVVEFPKFIQKLSTSLIQKTGDCVLAQIVRQVSPRLTYKVQQDFHSSYNLPIPPKNSVRFDKIDRQTSNVSKLMSII
jgi:Protein of unknown function (DUF1997)